MMGLQALLAPYLACQVKGDLFVMIIKADLATIIVNIGWISIKHWPTSLYHQSVALVQLGRATNSLLSTQRCGMTGH
jgi:hypothetical protein